MLISIQTGDIVDRLGIEKGYKAIRDAGFEAIDWNLDHAVKGSDLRKGEYLGKSILEKSLDEVIAYYEDELNVIKKNGLVITQAHAPFPACYPANPETLDYMTGIFKRNIEYCNYAGCKNLIIHGISLTLDDKVNTPETIHEMNMKLYTSLIPVILDNNVTVCLENLFSGNRGVMYHGHCGEASEAVRDIDYLNGLAGKEIFGFCLDTGHANLLHHDMRTYIAEVGHRIKALHIHDNNGANDQHMAPLTGTIEWQYFCEALGKAEYTGDLSFETFNQTNIALNFDESLVYPFMTLIAAEGKCFRRKIEEAYI